MPYIPRRVLPEKHYAVYQEAKTPVKTKARLLKEALIKVAREDKHIEKIDFIPSMFTLQLHGWISEGSDLKNLKQVQAVIKTALKTNKDPLKEIDKHKAKSHYDLRIKKKTAPSWFGLTPFRAPWTGTPENKVLGTVKGYQQITPGGKKLQKFLAEEAEKQMAREGVAERRDRIEWMKIKAQWFLPGSPGNPTKNLPAYMVAIEFYKTACLHRRDLDFFDLTFFGNYLKGRYYNRLVERKISPENLMEWQKKAIKAGQAIAFYDLAFYFWKAKDQWGDKDMPYDMEEVRKAGLGKITLDKIPAPPSKKKKVKVAKTKPPEATKEFH